MTISEHSRVGVLAGGMSNEREVSLHSGEYVERALRERGWQTVMIDAGPDLPERLRAERVEVAWIALHGAFGEDGCVQGLLEVMRIPYTGSGVEASAVTMDKHLTKRLLADSGIALPRSVVWRAGDAPPAVGAPAVVKPVRGGSTLGLHVCRDDDELAAALQGVPDGEPQLVEEMIEGEEITVAVLDGEALPVVGIYPDSGLFDYEAKYTKGKTRYQAPAEIPDAVAQAAQQAALAVYRQLDLAGLARADFIVRDGVPWFLEVNTSPGMTATSLSPMAAQAVGISYAELVERILLSARLHQQVAAGVSEPAAAGG